VTLLDRAHGVVWNQALHQRDPQMEGVPKHLASELEDLLRAIAVFPPADPARVPDLLQDLYYRQTTRAQAILREIRAMPGLARFMLGSTYETLRKAARDHPVVVLVAARDHAFALVMPSSSHADPDTLRLNIANDTLRSFSDSVRHSNMRSWRQMPPGDHPTRRNPLAELWLSVVKLVLTHLDLTVHCL
jgi:hypothetical protein